MQRQQIISRLAQAYGDNLSSLNEIKYDARIFGTHADWPWNGMILSGATRGGSARWTTIKPRYDSHFAWNQIEKLDSIKRRQALETVGRYKNRTADFLEGIACHLRSIGGPASLRSRLDAMTAYELIAFWTSFPGIGDKYARNIMMDVHDPRFHNGFFAVDNRIDALLMQLGYRGPAKYTAKEQFLNGLAAELGIDCWDLDRLLYTRNSTLQTLLSA